MKFHETTDRQALAKTSSDRSFGMVFATVFGIIAVWPVFHGDVIRWWSAAVAAVFLFLSLVRPSVLKPLNRIWTQLGIWLHKIVSPVIMGMLFFFVLTPTAMLLRMFGKVPLQLKKDPMASSYWIVRNPSGPEADTMKNQF